jgi:hypothetical protein
VEKQKAQGKTGIENFVDFLQIYLHGVLNFPYQVTP